MRESSFKEFVLDQLSELRLPSCRAMFGGFGLYADENFFGIIYKDRLYFKTDAATRRVYASMGMKPFRPNARQTLKSYYEVPADILEDCEQLTAWARSAIEARSAAEWFGKRASARRSRGTSAPSNKSRGRAG
jgi:DNA transformation protein